MPKLSATRILSTAGAGTVAAIAGWSSWSHMVGVALHVGESTKVAYVLPLSVDGLLVVASAALVDDKRSGRTPRWSARIAFAVGVTASLAANVAHAHPTWGARLVAAWPALALLLVVELLSRSGRKIEKPETVDNVQDKAPTEQVSDPHPVAVVTSPSLPAAPVSPAPYGPVSGHLGRPRMPLLSRPAQ